MAWTLCGIMPSSLEGAWREGVDTQCVRKDGHHACNHLFPLPNGRYLSWETDFECGCTEEDCGCFSYGECSLEEAQKQLLNEQSEKA